MRLASVTFGALKPIGSLESLEQLPNMYLVSVALGMLKPAGSAERLEQP